jgi:hypothetical protein
MLPRLQLWGLTFILYLGCTAVLYASSVTFKQYSFASAISDRVVLLTQLDPAMCLDLGPSIADQSYDSESDRTRLSMKAFTVEPLSDTLYRSPFAICRS